MTGNELEFLMHTICLFLEIIDVHRTSPKPILRTEKWFWLQIAVVVQVENMFEIGSIFC